MNSIKNQITSFLNEEVDLIGKISQNSQIHSYVCIDRSIACHHTLLIEIYIY